MSEIDHDPYEPKIDRRPFPWWLCWSVVAFLWVGSVYYGLIQWHSIALGIGTGAILASWAIDKTGNKVPDSWKTKR